MFLIIHYLHYEKQINKIYLHLTIPFFIFVYTLLSLETLPQMGVSIVQKA
jgi:hypothetical protein